MALLHKTTLTPSKLELLAGWVPVQPWFEGDAAAGFATVASFRFDDPDGEVGVETLLVCAGDGPVLQVPLTYRGAPLEGAEAWLIGTMEHGVLGPRWTYDALGDPVYLATLTAVILTGGHEVAAYHEVDGKRVFREESAQVVGSGAAESALAVTGPIVTRNDGWTSIAETPTLSPTLSVNVARAPVAHPLADAGDEHLAGTWTGQTETTVLAGLSHRG